MMPRTTRTTPRGAAIPFSVKTLADRCSCRICLATFGVIQSSYRGERAKPWVPRKHFDHIIAVRFVRGMNLGDPNVLVNVLVTCHRCNLAKKGAEDRLFVADVIGFTQKLLALGWSEWLYFAAAHFELWNICKLIRMT